MNSEEVAAELGGRLFDYRTQTSKDLVIMLFKAMIDLAIAKTEPGSG